MPLRQDGDIAGEGSPKRARRVALSLLVVGLAVLAFAAVASASIGFERTWGWGVSDGSNAFQICTSSCQGGIPGSGDGQFGFPEGVATDSSGNVYVTDEGNARIEKFDSSGNFLRTWGWGVSDGSNAFQVCTSSCQAGISGSGDGQFAIPDGIATDSSGNVYVTELSNNRIQEFDSSGNFLRTWGWGVSDGSNAFQVCTSSCQAGISGSGGGQFHRPYGIATDSSGNVYVADYSNQRVEKFDSSGNFLRTWGWGVSDGSNAFQNCTSSCQAGIEGEGDGQFSLPRGIATDSSGDVYVTSSGDAQVQKFASSGAFITKWGSGGLHEGQFALPWGIATDSSGDVYVSDNNNRRTQQFLVAPDAPTVSSSSPASPANDNSPKIIGSAEPGSTVKLYTSSDCSGSPLVTGSAAEFASPGLPVSVTDDSSTTFYATATDVTPSPCSAGFTYTEDSTPPVTTDNVPAIWQSHAVTVTLSAADSGSGVANTYYETGASPPDPTTSSPVYDPNSKPVLQNGEEIKYFSTDNAGNAEAVKTSAAAMVDTTPPAGAHILTALPAFTLQSPFQVAWGGATDSQSGLANYKAYKLTAPYNGSFGPSMLLATTSAPSSAFLAATPARTYCFYVTVTDNVGNISNASAQRCTALPVDDAALAAPGWTRKTGQPGYYQGTYSQSQAQGATLTRTGVQAKRLALVATKLPNGGTVQVAQGGSVLKQVSLAASTTQKEQVVPIASFASVHTGTVTIKVTSSGKPVIVDGLGVSRG